MQETETLTYEPLTDKQIDNIVALGYVLEGIHWGLIARGYRVTKNIIVPPPRTPLTVPYKSLEDYTEDEYTSWLTYAMGEVDWSTMHADQIEGQEDAEFCYDLPNI